MLLAFFGVIIAVNLTMAYFANSTWSGLVVANGYVASQSFDKDLAKARAQEALGWKVELSATRRTASASPSPTQQGSKIDGLDDHRRRSSAPSPTSEDQTLTFAGMGAGVYTRSGGTGARRLGSRDRCRRAQACRDYRKIFRFVVKD